MEDYMLMCLLIGVVDYLVGYPYGLNVCEKHNWPHDRALVIAIFFPIYLIIDFICIVKETFKTK